MGTTTNYGLPYPEATDLVIQGDDAIQALAEAVDSKLEWSPAAIFPRTESPAAVGSTAAVAWGSAALLAGFTYDTPTLTYTAAPQRLFIVDAEVSITISGAASLGSYVELRLNGNGFAASEDVIDIDGATMGVRRVTHRISTPVRLSMGDDLDVTASAGPAGVLGMVGLRVYPIGPAS